MLSAPVVEDKSPAERTRREKLTRELVSPVGGTERGERRPSKDRRPHENTRRGARDNRDVLRGRERSRVHRDRSPVEREERSPGENTRKDTRENTVARGDPKGQIPRGPRSQERLSTHNA
ncbi:hypothetical protein KUCAC02_033058 [Chaenocephalus aceratus]|nr:hypothetical protein KUCAC02_033058 [Chaenocephalus aceratus]